MSSLGAISFQLPPSLSSSPWLFKRLCGPVSFPFSQQRSYYTPTNADISIVPLGLAVLSVPNIVWVKYCVLAVSWQSILWVGRGEGPRTVPLVPAPSPPIYPWRHSRHRTRSSAYKIWTNWREIDCSSPSCASLCFPSPSFSVLASLSPASPSILGFSVLALLTTTTINCRRCQLLHCHSPLTPSFHSQCTARKMLLHTLHITIYFVA